MSNHGCDFVRHEQILVGQCPMTDCYLQPCSGVPCPGILVSSKPIGGLLSVDH